MFCQNCGKKNKDSAKFCYNCGSSLKIDEESNLTAFSENEDNENEEVDPLSVSFSEIRKNFSKFKSRAEDGNVYAMAVLGRYYSLGKEKNIEKTIRYYKKAVTTYPILYQRLGRIYEYEKEVRDRDLAVDYYMKGAELNEPESMIALGRCYRYGKGYLEEDYDKAMKLYKCAARQNSLHAMLVIAECYLEGEIVDKNDKIAFDWYSKVIETPSEDVYYKSEAYISIGKMYLEGNSFVSSNSKKAFNYFLQAKKIDDENDEAKWRVGYCYLEGIGINNDDDKAFECFESCIDDNGHLHSDEARYYLGYCYYYGRGVDEDEEYGLDLIKNSASFGYEEAITWCDDNGIDYEDI